DRISVGTIFAVRNQPISCIVKRPSFLGDDTSGGGHTFSPYGGGLNPPSRAYFPVGTGKGVCVHRVYVTVVVNKPINCSGTRSVPPFLVRETLEIQCESDRRDGQIRFAAESVTHCLIISNEQ